MRLTVLTANGKVASLFLAGYAIRHEGIGERVALTSALVVGDIFTFGTLSPGKEHR
jgi:hypothetical protein